jgi:hypothetical protein
MTVRYLQGRSVTFSPEARVAVCIAKNELLRLPYWLDYYRRLGFDRFIFVDNGSTDGTLEFFLSQPDAYVFTTDEAYSVSKFGVTWTNAVLDALCDGRWTLVADADELLVWPGSETEDVQDLTERMQANGAEAMFTMMLDMYSDKPFGKIGYVRGAPFLDATPFFDKGPYKLVEAKLFPMVQIYGGVRARVMEIKDWGPTVSKVPLLRWRKGQRFVLSTHALIKPVGLARMRGALLHFKMFDDLMEKCRIEVARKQHFGEASEYRTLGQAIDRAENRSFFDPKYSVRYTGTEVLLKLKLLNPAEPFEPRRSKAEAAKTIH